jgi:hypothetical protein
MYEYLVANAMAKATHHGGTRTQVPVNGQSHTRTRTLAPSPTAGTNTLLALGFLESAVKTAGARLPSLP